MAESKNMEEDDFVVTIKTTDNFYLPFYMR